MNETYLVHHGVKGMKWGVRRYQNPDGSYTKAGLKRRKKEIARARKQAVKYRSLMTDEELNRRVERLKQEDRLAELSTSRGKKAVSDTLERVGKTAAAGAGIYGLSVAGMAAVDKLQGSNESFWKLVISNLKPSQIGSAILNGGAKKK